MSMVRDETVYAYVDGELDAAARADVERAIAADPTLAARVARERTLRARLSAAFDPMLDEPLPERLLAAAGATRAPAAHAEASAPRSDAPSRVADLRGARARREARQADARGPLTWAAWGGMAASLVLGVLVGRLVLVAGGPLIGTTPDGRIVASGALAEALAHRSSSDAARDDIAVPVSFRDRRGTWCRSFTTRDRAGLACREGERWAIEWLAPASPEPAGGGLRTAGSTLPPAILQAIDQRIDGAPLDAAAERRALDAGWSGPR
jgi:anti-sigma factor RsiW